MERERYSTTLQPDLLKRLKILAIEQKKSANTLIEEALELLFEKYEEK